MTDENKPSPEPAPAEQGEAAYKFGYFPRAKYQDLVFYVKGDSGMNRQLFEMPDLPANRAMMDALLATRSAPTDEKALREVLQEAIQDSGHVSYCSARKGPVDEGWTVEKDCNCWVKKAVALLAHEAPKDGSAKTDANTGGYSGGRE